MARRNPKSGVSAVLALALATACAGGDGAAPSREPPRYAVAYTVFGEAQTMTYVNLLESLDVAAVDPADASEHPGWATIAAAGGKLFVSSGEAPEITRYGIGAAGALVREGSVHFGQYGLASAPFYKNVFVGEGVAYMNLEQVDRVLWDPLGLTIAGTGEAPGVPEQRDGMNVFAAYDRGIAVRGGDVFQPFYWTDPDFHAYHPTSQIAVYGADHQLATLLDVPCPALDTVTEDEEGNLYFSIWSGTAAYRILDPENAPQSCAVRIRAGERAVDAGWTRRFEELTGGRETAMFRYLADGVGIVAVLHHERITIAPDTHPWTINYGSNWKMWRVDLDAWTATPIDELPWFAGGYYSFEIDGRTLVLLPSADFASTRAYEVAVDGTVTPRFETPGWAYQLVDLG